MEGYIGIKPEIKKIEWIERKYFTIYLMDGRVIQVPLKYFPSMKKVKLTTRLKPQVINGNMFTWPMCSEVYHIEQVLGKEEDYKYKGVSE